jgi:hypothetical protein
MDGISVYQARLNLGETLAKRVISTVPPNEIDVVIPIPESSRPSAMQLAHLLGKPYREGFVKNRYVGRTFIMPGQAVRKKSVRQKLNAIASEFKGRNVLLVDDSIVRGTTSKEIVQMARDAGARKVYWPAPRRRCASPTSTASTCPRARTGGARPQRGGDPPDHRRRCADLPGRRRTSSFVFAPRPRRRALCREPCRATSIRVTPTRPCARFESASPHWKAPSRRSPPRPAWRRSCAWSCACCRRATIVWLAQRVRLDHQPVRKVFREVRY